MFDGSHRTNKREINLGGKSSLPSSSKSTRTSNLDAARRERKARSERRARCDSSLRMQRLWRGRMCRGAYAMSLGVQYAECIDGIISKTTVINDDDDDDDDDDDVGDDAIDLEMGREDVDVDDVIDDNEAMMDDSHHDHDHDHDEEGNRMDDRAMRLRRRRRRLLKRAASILACRMTPPLLPHYFVARDGGDGRGRRREGGGGGGGLHEDTIDDDNGDGANVEACMRRDLLYLGEAISSTMNDGPNAPLLGGCDGNENDDDEYRITDVAMRRIISTTLVLLRRSMAVISGGGADDSGGNDVRRHRRQCDENEQLLHLLDDLLGMSRASDGRMAICPTRVVGNGNGGGMTTINGWAVDLFLCLRDVVDADVHNGAVRVREMSSALLRLCCGVVLNLAYLDVEGKTTTGGVDDEAEMMPMLHRQGLALLASIIFSSTNLSSMVRGEEEVEREEGAWMHEVLTSFLSKLERLIVGSMKCGGEGRTVIMDDFEPFSLLLHYLSHSVNSLLSVASSSSGRIKNAERRIVPAFSLPTLLTASDNNSSSSESGQLLDAIRDTLSTREIVVLDNVLSHANARQRQQSPHPEILTHTIPVILQYTLQHQQDLTILASCAARGENVAPWALDTKNGGSLAADTLIANVPAVENMGDDADDDSDDDDGDGQSQQRPQRPSMRDASSASASRHSRADLQTLPKLDALYQTNALRAKQATVDRLRSMPRGHVELLVALAEKIGRGEWIKQLSIALFSPTQFQPSSSLLKTLSPLSWHHWQRQAQLAYTTALATVMTSCSGIKPGRNAASPLLAKLAFSDSFLERMWERSALIADMLAANLKTEKNASAMASACEVLSSFCDCFSHQLLAVNDDDFLRRYHHSEGSPAPAASGPAIVAKDVVRVLRMILNDLYWIRPVLASDMANFQNDPDSNLRFQRARLLLSGTKLWNSLYERWCRLYRVVQFCEEDSWWFPHLASWGQHERNPIIQSQTRDQMVIDDMDLSSAGMNDEMDEEAFTSQDAGADALANTFRDPKMGRVLTYIPQAMPFSRRVTLFNSLLESDKLRTQDETMSLRQMMMNFEEEEAAEISGRERVTIRRDLLYSDSKHRLNQLGKRLRKKVQVTFVNKHGQQEAGIDGGGVFKEFLDDLIRDAFLPEIARRENAEGEDDDRVRETHPNFFSVTPLQTLTVNTALDGDDSTSHYEFLGRVLGKAIYGASFSLSFFGYV
jgi:hypothetical protein